jgi:hypothetical protein
MITLIISLILQVICLGNAQPVNDVVSVAPVNDEREGSLYHAEAKQEYADEFTALFNSYECKRAKNGAMMIRRSGEKSFKFAKKG